jgi:hypothetical protein
MKPCVRQKITAISPITNFRIKAGTLGNHIEYPYMRVLEKIVLVVSSKIAAL